MVHPTMRFEIVECLDGNYSIGLTLPTWDRVLVDEAIVPHVTESTLQGLLQDALSVGSTVALDMALLAAMYMAQRQGVDLEVKLEGSKRRSLMTADMNDRILSYLTEVVEPRMRINYYEAEQDLSYRFSLWTKWLKAQCLTRRYSRLSRGFPST